MGKKQKDETPNVHATPNRDIIQRLNFLYQASVYLQSLESPIPSLPENESHPSSSGKFISKGKNKESQITDTSKHTQDFDGKEKKKKHTSRCTPRKKQTTGDLARSYVQSMRVVGQKTTVKIDPSLKRSLCSSCSTTLIPGSSASVRIKKSSSHGHLVIYTCLHCKTSKSIPAPPTLPLNLAAGTEEFEGSLNTSSVVPGASEPSDKSTLLTVAAPSQSQFQRSRRKGKQPTLSSHHHPRLLPLFARPDAGHVVFRGNESLLLDQGGLGVSFA